MMRKTTWALALCAALVTSCTVKKSEDAEGDTQLDVEPANIEVGTDTATVKVPDINISPDTDTVTTTRQ